MIYVRRLILVAVVMVSAVLAIAASSAFAGTSRPPLAFEFTKVPDMSQIYALNVVSFTITAHNPTNSAKDGIIFFPSWVTTKGKSNQHLTSDKAGQLN